MGAYFVTCTGYEKDENGNVTVVHATYDPETKSGSGFNARKVKGTIHWVAVPTAEKAECRLYENIVDEEKGKLNAFLKDCEGIRQLPVHEEWIFLRGLQGQHRGASGI